MNVLYLLISIAALAVICPTVDGFTLQTSAVVTVAEGTEATLLCQKRSDSGSLVSPCSDSNTGYFSWLANDSLVASCRQPRVENDYHFDTETGTLRISNVNISMDGLRFDCRDLSGPRFLQNTTILFVFNPKSIAVEGEDAFLECAAARAGRANSDCLTSTNLTIKWQANTSLVASCSTSGGDCSDMVDMYTGTLRIPNVEMWMDETTYTCHFFNCGMLTTSYTRLIVYRAIGIETIPVLNGIRGERLTLPCFVTSIPSRFPTIYFQWFLSNKPIQDACVSDKTTKIGKYDFDHNNSSCNLTINDLELTDERNYRCEACYSASTEGANTSVTVNVLPKFVRIINGRTGAILIGDVFVRSDTNHTFICLATSSKPAAEITWLLDGQNSSGKANVVGEGLFNTSSTITVQWSRTRQRRILTCTAVLEARRVSTTIFLQYGPPVFTPTENTPGTLEQTRITVVFIAVAVMAAFLVLLTVTVIALRKCRKRNTPTGANQPVVNFRRTDTERPTASVGPVPNTAAGSADSGNIYEANDPLPPSRSFLPLQTPNSISHNNVQIINSGPQDLTDIPSTSSRLPIAKSSKGISKGFLAHSRLYRPERHRSEARPVDNAPTSQYATIDRSLLASSVDCPPLSGKDSSSPVEEGHGEEGEEEKTPPLPPRGNPILLPPPHL